MPRRVDCSSAKFIPLTNNPSTQSPIYQKVSSINPLIASICPSNPVHPFTTSSTYPFTWSIHPSRPFTVTHPSIHLSTHSFYQSTHLSIHSSINQLSIPVRLSSRSIFIRWFSIQSNIYSSSWHNCIFFLCSLALSIHSSSFITIQIHIISHSKTWSTATWSTTHFV